MCNVSVGELLYLQSYSYVKPKLNWLLLFFNLSEFCICLQQTVLNTVSRYRFFLRYKHEHTTPFMTIFLLNYDYSHYTVKMIVDDGYQNICCRNISLSLCVFETNHFSHILDTISDLKLDI